MYVLFVKVIIIGSQIFLAIQYYHIWPVHCILIKNSLLLTMDLDSWTWTLGYGLLDKDSWIWTLGHGLLDMDITHFLKFIFLCHLIDTRIDMTL